MSDEPIADYIFTEHALEQMAERGLDKRTVAAVLARPEQRVRMARGRVVAQSRILFRGRLHLLRVVVDLRRKPAAVVTAYHTSAIERYWREES